MPDISGKLIKPASRQTLTKQRRFWDFVIERNGPIYCIYTGNPLHKGAYHVEHFVPYSFVSHDQIWNLIPSEHSFNISKSNKLPPLDRYFDPFHQLQELALNTFIRERPSEKLLEDYFYIVSDPRKGLPKEQFYNIIHPPGYDCQQQWICIHAITLKHFHMNDFLNLPAERRIGESHHFFLIWDSYPVSPGHLLIISKELRKDYFELSIEEQKDLPLAIKLGRDLITQHHLPEGFNIGMNCGETAGQTVFHFHCHLIPRYNGDMSNPRGGVRHCIAGKGYY